ncbi:MAG: ABC transporter permease subunit [Clostridium sp.]|jgi:peptide/nickel transport system permease protein|uniref:ABC transporter permease n=1 Tax=Clostridium sp. TaxID=1506 RepID=UPI0025B7AB5C|nr:ABC transporter permease subunit [Clostridium sp.]MCH3963768.1 ABC transporter permease subunit [Clostridium sp.]MCI1714909.1 ABC transporter permease subunit [Clostridium sp.]MCI1798902.1 ABC transporter permease subunit [Clostridium sp.]MCI1813092.1 ABC transporter permease subunit [Clostridium sp.]MCI1869982.1 ABC transporter permease subunit [Clostridium sp.]
MDEVKTDVGDKSYFNNVLYCLRSDKLAVAGGVIVVFFILIGIFAPYIAPHNPLDMDLQRRLLKPSFEFPLGTDQLGRCILSRLIYGTRTSFSSSLIVLAGILAIAVPLGVLAGYIGGWVDNFIMRLADIVLTFPSSIVALAVVGIFGPGIFNIMLVLISLWWAPFARIIRGTVLKLKKMDFIMAATAAGTSKFNIVIKHILLNAISPIIVLATLKVASIITHIAAFSFIGLGTQPPAPDWGVMLSDSRQFISSDLILMIWPGLTIMVVVFGLNMFGEGLNEALSPNSD